MKNKTNAMRLLEGARLPFEILEYAVDESDLSGNHIAREIGIEEDRVFKTLVARGDKTGYCVFCIPTSCELDLKKAARISDNKSMEMLHVKDLLSVTGYIRGGCSPVGMKKKFPTYIDETAQLYEKITVSAGVRGAVLLLSPTELCEFCEAHFCDLVFY